MKQKDNKICIIFTSILIILFIFIVFFYLIFYKFNLFQNYLDFDNITNKTLSNNFSDAGDSINKTLIEESSDLEENEISTDKYSKSDAQISTIDEYSISFIRMDHSIKSKNNAIIAYLYYDKPFISNDTETIKKINTYLEDEYYGWINDKNRLNYYNNNTINEFFRHVNDYREFRGDEYLAEDPFKYFISCETMYIDNNIFSIKQTRYYYIAGPSYTSYFGTTFDLNTGEVIPLDKLIDINADDFRNKILSYVMENVVEKYYKNSYDEAYETNYKIYAPNENHDFKLGYGGEPYELNYDYYYDGEYYYIILRDVAPINYEIILKWSGNMEDEFEGVYNYWLKKDNTFKLIKDE